MLSDKTINRRDIPSLPMRAVGKLRRYSSKLFRNGKNKAARKRLENKDFSLICSNCIGGVLYHDLGMKFLSPTINMFFDGEDFVRFCENMDDYLAMEIEFLEDTGFSYPIGKIGDVELHFIHYHTRSECVDKWNERKKRINRDNLFVIATDRDGMAREDLMKRFDRLPYKKIMYTARQYPEYSWAVYVPAFKKRKNVGVMTGFSDFKGTRYYEAAFDIVGWLNQY